MHKKPVGLGWAKAAPKRPISTAMIWAIICSYLVWCFFDIRAAITTLFATMAWVSAIFAVFRLLAIISPKPPDYDVADPAEDLPHYTVLVPLFKEAQMVPHLIDSLSTLHYPQDKLDIVLITEAVDPFTGKAVEKHLRAPFRHIVVPKGDPQTKPRALNYALQSCDGEFVTIYDAEDRPHPDQLLTAVAAFRARPDWAAVQAPLDYFNANDNWLTRQFALEYAALFHVWVPFLTRLGLPFPLGGTSNHMRRAPLDLVGGWDAHNVTEDADLSFRLAAHSFEIGYIHPPTQEEAVSILRDWRYQRSRWIKGYIQTWDVHMSRPFAPGGWKGVKRFFTLQLTLGLTLLSILFYTPVVLGLPFIALTLWWVGTPLEIGPIYGATFIFSISVGCLIGAIGALRSGKDDLIRSCLSMPAYWLLLFEPALRAFKEMRHMRFHWHKTRHGVSRTVPIPTQSQKLAVTDKVNISNDRLSGPLD